MLAGRFPYAVYYEIVMTLLTLWRSCRCIVPGGGVAYMRCLDAVKALKVEGDEHWGAKIVFHALEEPVRQIAESAGHDGSIVADKVWNGSGSFGFNAYKEEYEDLLEAGVIDPAKVTRLALQNAASVAGLMLTTEVMISEKPKEKDAPAMPGGGMPGGGMY
jgi:chaperonin GroEL